MRKSQARQAREDAAWLRAQQIDLTTEAVEPVELSAAAVRPLDGIPETCPHCAKRMTLDSGWTILTDQKRGPGVRWLSCGGCGSTVPVSITARNDLRDALRKHFALRARILNPIKPVRQKRQRGAG